MSTAAAGQSETWTADALSPSDSGLFPAFFRILVNRLGRLRLGIMPRRAVLVARDGTFAAATFLLSVAPGLPPLAGDRGGIGPFFVSEFGLADWLSDGGFRSRIREEMTALGFGSCGCGRSIHERRGRGSLHTRHPRVVNRTGRIIFRSAAAGTALLVGRSHQGNPGSHLDREN